MYILLITTIYNTKSIIERPRKRPKTTSTSAKTLKVLFNKKSTKILLIPIVYNKYNY